MFTDEKQHNGAGASVRTDGGSNVGDEVYFDAISLPGQIFQPVRIPDAIGVRDKNGSILLSVRQLTVFACQRFDGFPSVSGGGDLYQMSLTVHVQNRLDAQQASHKGNQGTDTAAPL